MTGGATRAESVRAALAEVPEDAAVVVVHDAARPLVADDVIERVLAPLSEGCDGAVPALPIADTVKRVRGGEVVETLDRCRARGRPDAAGVPRAPCCARRSTATWRARRDCASPRRGARGGRVKVGRGRPPPPQGDRAGRPRARRATASTGARRLPHRISALPSASRGSRSQRRGRGAVRRAVARGATSTRSGCTEHIYYFRETRFALVAPVPAGALRPRPRRLLRRGPRGQATRTAGEARPRGRLGARARRAARRRCSSRTRGTSCSAPCTDRRRRRSISGRGLWASRSVDGVVAHATHASSRPPRGAACFDVLAHPDLVKIFGDRVDWDWQPVIARARGVALEVSTAGLRKPVGALYPDDVAAARGEADHARLRAHLAVGRRPRPRPRGRARPPRGFDTVTVFDGRAVAPGAARVSELRVGIGFDAHALERRRAARARRVSSFASASAAWPGTRTATCSRTR